MTHQWEIPSSWKTAGNLIDARPSKNFAMGCATTTLAFHFFVEPSPQTISLHKHIYHNHNEVGGITNYVLITAT